jgi:DNA-binding NarL/FixJ family response regulator
MAAKPFHRHRPDITLMDSQMPEMNGVDAITAIRREFPETRTIVLTCQGDVQALRAMKASASGYMLNSVVR